MQETGTALEYTGLKRNWSSVWEYNRRRTKHGITRSFLCPSGSHQPSSNRLAPPERPTTSNLAPYHRVWPATDQPWPQLGVASRTRSVQMAFSCGDGYAHRWACHLMRMMMYQTAVNIRGFLWLYKSTTDSDTDVSQWKWPCHHAVIWWCRLSICLSI